MHSPSHRNFPVHTLPVLLLPAIKNRQFIMMSEAGRPVFYISWGNFSEEAKQRYLTHSPLLIPETDWNSGDRMWLLDWVAPFGHTAVISHLLKIQIFTNRCARGLYHRGNARGLGVRTFKDMAVLREEAKPVAYPHHTMPPSPLSQSP